MRRKLTNVILIEVYRTIRWPVQTAQQMQERTFARAGLSHQRELFTARHFEIQILEDDQKAIPGAVALGQADGPDRGIARHGHGSTCILWGGDGERSRAYVKTASGGSSRAGFSVRRTWPLNS